MTVSLGTDSTQRPLNNNSLSLSLSLRAVFQRAGSIGRNVPHAVVWHRGIWHWYSLSLSISLAYTHTHTHTHKHANTHTHSLSPHTHTV